MCFESFKRLQSVKKMSQKVSIDYTVCICEVEADSWILKKKKKRKEKKKKPIKDSSVYQYLILHCLFS